MLEKMLVQNLHFFPMLKPPFSPVLWLSRWAWRRCPAPASHLHMTPEKRNYHVGKRDAREKVWGANLRVWRGGRWMNVLGRRNERAEIIFWTPFFSPPPDLHHYSPPGFVSHIAFFPINSQISVLSCACLARRGVKINSCNHGTAWKLHDLASST